MFIYNLQFAQDAKFWVNQGNRQLEQGKILEAIDSYDQAIRIQPDYYFAWSSRGLVLGNLGRYEEALISFDKTLQIQPNDYLTLLNQGVVLGKLNRCKEALISFDQAIQIQPDDYLAWVNQGNALNNLGRCKEALISFDRAIQIQPDDYLAWFNRGNALYDLDQYEGAIVSFDQAIQIKPEFYLALDNRGTTLYNLGKYEEALACCNQTIKIHPDFYQAWSRRGAILANIFDKNEEAIASFDRAIQIQPDFYEAWRNRGIAANRSHYNPRYQEQFVELFEMELSSTFQILLKSLENTDTETFIGQFLTSLATFHQLLARTFPNLNLSTDTEPLLEFLRQNRIETLKNFIRQPLSPSVKQKLQQDTLLHPYCFNPALNLRGYEGELASYYAGLEFVRRDSQPEGCGKLYHAIGRAHYSKGQLEPNPKFYNTQAEISYETALETLTPEQCPKFHLEVLQDLIKVKLALGKLEEAENEQLKGLETFKQLLNQKTSTREKRQVETKFNSFRSLRVDILVKKGKFIDALTSAELEKNRRLTHILEKWKENTVSPSYEEIKYFLSPNRAIIYWHLSPYALTTFIVKYDCDVRGDVNTDLNELETWIKTWDRDYQNYRGKGKNKTQTMRESHPWRKEMSDRLQQLKDILSISSLQSHLSDITELILIPHRDLHRFPLHELLRTWDKIGRSITLPVDKLS